MARRDKDDINDDRTPEEKSDDEIIIEAKDRFRRAMSYEGSFRPLFVQDVRFVNGDPDNHWQWPDEVYNQRTSDTNRRPTMTCNIVQGVANYIINDTRQNMPAIAVKPTGGESTFKSAEAYEAVFRHIQYQSSANAIYIDAHQHQVWGGVGYFRVITKYAEENPKNDVSAFNLVMKLDPVRSHMGVLLDCDNTKQKSGADAKWGFVFDSISKDEYRRLYPQFGEPPTNNALDSIDDWVQENTIRIAEYYRIVGEQDELIYFEQPDDMGQSKSVVFRMSEAPKEMARAIRQAEGQPGVTIKRRKVWNNKLQWFKIAGNKIIDRNLKMPGSGTYVPIVRVLGREVIVENVMDRKGVVRPLKDNQRLFNYYLSTDAEFNALQPKSPYIGYKESFEGNEAKWNALNISNPPYLPVNMISDEIDGPIPIPTRQQPVTDAPAYANGMQRALQYMGFVSGLPEANLGQTSNERSGLALRERRRGGDNANYDFSDNLADAVCHAGRIMIDWFPDVYDTARVIQIMAKDGQESEITIDPEAKAAYDMKKVGDVEKIILNPNVGKYEIQSDVGPAYATQRQEAWEAFQAIVTRSPELMGIFGDLLFYTADFPLSDKIAERMVRQIRATSPWLLDENAPPPMVQQIMAQNDQLRALNQQLMEHIGAQQRKLEDKTADNERKGFEAQARAETENRNADSREQDAISKRITAVTNAQLDLSREGKEGQFHELLTETMEMADRTQFDPEAFGAKQAPDGKHYMPDPKRPGKYLLVGG